MRILLIGGSGNISFSCASLLVEKGHDVSLLTRGHRAPPPGCHLVAADRFDRQAMGEAVKDGICDVVINFLGFDLPELEIDFEVFSGSIRRYIFISSATVYAKPHILPITERSPLGNVHSEYAQKKQACEEWLMARHDARRFPVTIVRPSHTYSREWIPNTVSSAGYTFASRMEAGDPVFVHDDGQGLWTLTAAADFAVGLAGLAGNADAAGEMFHITSDEVLTWNQVYVEIARALGVESPRILKIPTEYICGIAPEMTAKLKGDKSHHGVFDNAKIKRFVPEFNCRKSFRDGMTEAVEWFRANPRLKLRDPEVDRVFDLVTAAWEAEKKQA